jgi:branched-chain amino acid transport system ATP-binding protein
MELLKVENVKKSFGAIKVADDVCLSLGEGEAVGIIGPNGAGKSSLFNLIGGNVRPDSGEVHFDGKRITHCSPQQRCQRGIGRTYQVPQPFAKMTVFENCLTAAAFGVGHSERQCYRHCAEVLERTGLVDKANHVAGSLTLLERKRLEVARALASSPRLVLLDEIAGGLTENETGELVKMISAVHASGTTIFWIEHIVNALLAVVSRLVVIHFGAMILDGEPRSVMASDEVQRIYLGMEGIGIEEPVTVLDAV